MRYVNVYVAAETDEPTIGSFTAGTITSLGLTTEKINSRWYLVVHNPQDYEVEYQRFYRFTVRAGGVNYDVVLYILNVDDEYPYFTLPDSTPCNVNVSNLTPFPNNIPYT
jgi:hypothetical protein